nr:hypothetical protein [Tanacetum cinerariifolium]
MSTPTFAITHNLVTFLEKPAESAGFEQIIDFLKFKPIHYALTVNPTIYVSCVKQFWATTKVKKVNDQEQIQVLVDKKKVIITEDSIRSDLRFDDADGTVCLLNEAIFEGLARMRKQRNEAEVSNDESDYEDHVPTPSSDPLSSEPKAAQAKGIDALKKKVSRRVKPHMEKDILGAQEDASKQGRMIDQNAEIALDDKTQGRTNDDKMFGVNDLAGEEVVMDTKTGKHEEQIIEDVSEPVSTAGEVVTTTTVKDSAASTTNVTEDEITMAQALAALKSIKPKVVVQEQEMSTTIPVAATTVTTDVPTPRAKGIVFHEQKQSQIPTASSSKDKGKAKMIEHEVPIKKKDQMRINKELLAERLQAREREEFSKVQKARLLVELIEKRKKHFATLRAQEKRNKPPTKTQMKSQMSTYLKHTGGYKHSHLKGRSFDEIKKLFDREMRKVNDFIPMDSEAQKRSAKESQESSAKRTTEHLESDISKKQKVDENVEPVINDSEKLKKCMEIVPDDGDEVLIKATPLSSKSLTIIEYKIHKEGKKTYFKIIRADVSAAERLQLLQEFLLSNG